MPLGCEGFFECVAAAPFLCAGHVVHDAVLQERWFVAEAEGPLEPLAADVRHVNSRLRPELQVADAIGWKDHPHKTAPDLGNAEKKVGIGFAVAKRCAEEGAQVRLLQQAFTPDRSKDEAQQLFAANVADHVAAGLQNLRPMSQPELLAPQKSFLEQSVFADGLSAESVATLHQLSNTLWREVLERVVQAATPLCEQDKETPQPERFRLGLFSYSQKEASSEGAQK